MNKAVAIDLSERIRAEYLDMPGLALRPEQVQRLCSVDGAACRSVLDALVERGFLSRRSDGAYGRSRHPETSRARQARASLVPDVAGAAARTRAS